MKQRTVGFWILFTLMAVIVASGLGSVQDPKPGVARETFVGVPLLEVANANITRQFPNATLYTDTLGEGRVTKLKVSEVNGMLYFEDGTPYSGAAAMLMHGLKPEQIDFFVAKRALWLAEAKLK